MFICFNHSDMQCSREDHPFTCLLPLVAMWRLIQPSICDARASSMPRSCCEFGCSTASTPHGHWSSPIIVTVHLGKIIFCWWLWEITCYKIPGLCRNHGPQIRTCVGGHGNGQAGEKSLITSPKSRKRNKHISKPGTAYSHTMQKQVVGHKPNLFASGVALVCAPSPCRNLRQLGSAQNQLYYKAAWETN